MDNLGPGTSLSKTVTVGALEEQKKEGIETSTTFAILPAKIPNY